MKRGKMKKRAPTIYLNCMQTINISLKPTKNNIPTNFLSPLTLYEAGCLYEGNEMVIKEEGKYRQCS